MKLEDQVISLKLARKLKELGVRQESYFVWFNRIEGTMRGWCLSSDWQEAEMKEHYSAFTVAELGEMLPSDCSSNNMYFDSGNVVPWRVKYERNEKRVYKHAHTEANARAEMLIYLIKNKLIKLKEK